MVSFTSGELLQVLIDSCRKSTESILYLNGQNPFKLSLNGNTCRVFIANISHTSRIDPDEYRIQCPGDLPDRLEASKARGETICVLGYHAESGVFSAWDPRLFLKRSRRSQRFSMYTRLSGLWSASKEGFARYVDSDDQTVLMFRSDYLCLYVENSDFIHGAGNSELQEIVTVYGSTPIGSIPKRRVEVAKRRIKVTHTQYARSPRFRHEVLSAYDNRCAMCQIQLELIEAAHLVPHSHPKGLDIIGNGVALCALHHKALDSGLLFIDVDYSIKVNQARYSYLVKMNLMDGLKQLNRYLNPSIDLPHEVSQHPLKVNIALGNQIRGIGID